KAARQGAAVRMPRQLRDKMRVGEFVLKSHLFSGRPLTVNKFEKVETNCDAIYPDEIAHVRDVVDVTIESRLLLERTDEHGIDADDPAPGADHLDLLVGDVALDV